MKSEATHEQAEEKSSEPNTKSATFPDLTRKKGSTTGGAIVLLVIALLIVAIVAWTNSGPKAKYSSSVDTSSMVVVNPATLSVGGTVTNTGKKAGDPYCTLDVQDTSGHYNGADAFQLSSTLQPGQSTHWQDPSVTITSQGASYVTEGTITCQ